jgi:hypothetical protein
MLELVEAIRGAYRPFAPPTGSQPTDTLVSKIILGTVGCLPACDRYFIDGFKREGYSYTRLNDPFLTRILQFCEDHRGQLHSEKKRIELDGGIRYPFMKLVDMNFWQVGYERDQGP